MKMCPVIHFEMPADDKKRMAKFYASTFGWKTDFLGAAMNDYVVVTTTESTEMGRPKNPGAINGGFFQRTDDKNTQHPSLVIAVDDMSEAMAAVKEAGGTVVGEPMEIPGVGLYVSIIDTEGNNVSLLKPSGSSDY